MKTCRGSQANHKLTVFCLASTAEPSRSGGETDCSFMLYLKIEHVFENYMRGNCPVDLPLLAGFTRKICQHHLETRAANV